MIYDKLYDFYNNYFIISYIKDDFLLVNYVELLRKQYGLVKLSIEIMLQMCKNFYKISTFFLKHSIKLILLSHYFIL